MDTANVIDYVRTFKGPSPCGVSSEYISLGNGWGVKMWPHEGERDECYDRQESLARLNFAPNVGEKIHVGNRFGYITQEADVLVNILETDPYSDEWDYISQQYESEINLLTEDVLEATGWNMCDNHIGNFGLIDGQLVIIDVGDMD